MNIAFLSNTMGRGGAEMQIKDYAVRLVRRGHRVVVISMMPFEDFEPELLAAGVETATLDLGKGKASAAALTRLVTVLVRFRPDVVHAHMFSAILASRIARAFLEPLRLLGFKRPVVIGTSHAPFERTSLRYVAYRLSDRLGDLWTNVSRAGIDKHERVRAVPKGAGVLTANGIDVERFRPDPATRETKRAELDLEPETFLWTTVGSFRDDHKDYPTLLRAAARLDRTRPWVIAIAGAGLLLEETQALARELGVADRIRFLGLRADVLQLLQASDAFVLASWSEAMPIVLLESGACALPAVVTNVGESAAIVAEGTGFVVPSKSPEALAEAMTRVLEMPRAHRIAMGDRAREHVTQQFAIDVIVRSWEERYAAMAHVALPTPTGTRSTPDGTLAEPRSP